MADLESFEKFNYSLRPCKQVERRLLIEMFRRLEDNGLPIRNYRYVGFGSVYYADFILFHKLLYIDKMTCVEKSDIPKRMKFNRPYKFIKLKMMDIADVIPKLPKTKKHIVWLDYDFPLNDEILEHVEECVEVLYPGSILLVTVEARAKVEDDQDRDDLTAAKRERTILNNYEDWFGSLVDYKFRPSMLGASDIPKLFWDAFTSKVNNTLLGFPDLKYLPLVNCLYADNAPMITFGGLIDGSEEVDRLKNETDLFDLEFVTDQREFVEVSVPPLTLREKQWLDSNISKSLNAANCKFEIKQEMLENYCKFYRDYPTYLEALL